MTHLQAGDKAPLFTGIDQHGKKISLKDYRGKKLVLYFYPKDMTPGCTTQACSLRDNYDALLAKGYAVIGISNDDVKSHAKFAKKYQLPFPLIADIDKKIVHLYGVYGEKKFMGLTFNGIHRTTFLISEEAVIEEVIDKKGVKFHTNLGI